MPEQEKEPQIKRAMQISKTRVQRCLRAVLIECPIQIWKNPLAFFIIILITAFLAVILPSPVSEYVIGLFGEKDSKKNEALTFLGLGVGGLVLWRRAISAEKHADAMKDATNNQAKAVKLTEVGHTQERLKNAIEHLGNNNTSTRIGAAYELYHLANKPEYLKTACDILCGHIRQKTQEEEEYKEKQKEGPSEEVKTFLNLLCGKDKGELFSQCQINLSLSFLQEADLSGAQLRGADLRDAQLQGADLRDAQLQGADLRDAQLQGADLSKAQLQGADLSGSHLQGADLSKAQLQGANLSGAQLQEADLRDAQLQEARLLGSQLRGADLRDAQLQEARLLGSQLRGADLSGSQLRGADLSGSQLRGADLSGSQLRGADLSGSQLQGADLSGSQLQGADLSGAKLQEANLSEAQLQGIGSSKPFNSFQNRILARAGKESDFTDVVFSGGLNADQVKTIIASMPDGMDDKEKKEMGNKLNAHVDKAASNKLPDNSGAITGTYSKDEAEKWIAEYEESIKSSVHEK